MIKRYDRRAERSRHVQDVQEMHAKTETIGAHALEKIDQHRTNKMG